MTLICAVGKYPKFDTISTYTLSNNTSSIHDIHNVLSREINLNTCLCKLKLYEVKEGFHKRKHYTFSNIYNNSPNMKIEIKNKETTFLIAYEDNNTCYCNSSKYEYK